MLRDDSSAVGGDERHRFATVSRPHSGLRDGSMHDTFSYTTPAHAMEMHTMGG